MRKWLEVVAHILFWSGSAWLIASGFSIQAHEIELIDGVETVKILRNTGIVYQLLICIFISLIAFYTSVWLIMSNSDRQRTKGLIWFLIFTFVCLTALIYTVTELRFFGSAPPIPKQIAFGIAFFYFAIALAYGFIKKSVFDAQRHQQLIIDKKQAELNLLRNQLQPHFLFNALNNLMSLASASNNVKLVNSFDKLSQLLRFVIEDNKTEKIVVSKEIKFLKNYIELQKLRFEDGEVIIRFMVSGGFDKQKIEPGLFIPFVENAFKYGTEPEKTATIDIEFDLSKANSVRFKIKNKKMISNINGSGLGVETTKKRLELIYPDRHHLQIINSDDYTVHLTIYTQ
ncbi:hypothetical protein GC194_08635 [bacterium]|nr:hypothetical protein [bacterium]